MPIASLPRLLSHLSCPLTNNPLKIEGDFLVDTVHGIRYPIVNGIPRLLKSAAVLPEGVLLESLSESNPS